VSGQPLEGLRVAVTRSREQADSFSAKLEALGAVVITFPTIAITSPENTEPLDRALAQLATYDWVIFTSVNGVEQFWKHAHAVGAYVGAIHRCHVAAVGPTTADALRARGVEPDVVPDKFVAEAILDALPDVQGLRILLPRADIARAALPDQLVAYGAQVDDVATYRNVPGQPAPQAFDMLRAGVDVITFTSASTVRNFVNIIGDELDAVLGDATIACIGPITGQAARELDLPVHIVPEDYTIEGLTEAIVAAIGKTVAGV
jgi:uroporphyrinogen-III synthase